MILQILLLIASVPLEITLDRYLWRLMRDDKPISTILRAVYMAVVSIGLDLGGYTTWWQALVLQVIFHLFAFDFALNLVRGKPFFYHPDKGFDRIYQRIPNYAELIGKCILLYTAIIIYFRIEWVTG